MKIHNFISKKGKKHSVICLEVDVDIDYLSLLVEQLIHVVWSSLQHRGKIHRVNIQRWMTNSTC